MSSSALELTLARAWTESPASVRYAQCWEDADVLLDALNVAPGATCVSIVSAGDNTLALLSQVPERVIAVDVNPAQLSCLELRVAAYTVLDHPEMLELLGSLPSSRRRQLYSRCRPYLSPSARIRWDSLEDDLDRFGAAGVGKLERYLAIFRRLVLPAILDRDAAARLLQPSSRRDRERDYARYWETWRWRLLYHLFFSRFSLGRLGRDKACFRYVDGPVPERLLSGLRYALTVRDPSRNPYLAWILTGRHENALPFSLRHENFETIRRNLHRLEWHCGPVQDVLSALPSRSVDCFNLSDIFEYVSPDECAATLAGVARTGRAGARVAYWNLLASRSRPDALAPKLRPLREESARLHRNDNLFFYSNFVLEEVI